MTGTRGRAIGSFISGFDVPVAAEICMVAIVAGLIMAGVIFVAAAVRRRLGRRARR